MPTIEDLMASPVVTATADESLHRTAARMRQSRVGSVVVVRDDVPVGILTERDVLSAVAGQEHLEALSVADVMTSPADTVGADTEPRSVLEIMSERGYRHMPVVRDGELAGVVSLRDVARSLADGPITAPKGLKGVVVAETEVGDVRGGEGFYHYRQFPAIELAESRPLEDVWQLLIDGRLPATGAERERFAAEVRPLRSLTPAVGDALPAIARVSEPLEGLRTALSLAAAERGCRPVYDLDESVRRADAIFVAAVTPTILTSLHRLRSGRSVVHPRGDLDYAANYLWMLTGEEPDPARADAIKHYLVSTIDHGFNASTFTARVIASTGADMGAAVTGAIGALSGPLHGGAPSRALDLLEEIGTDSTARAVIEEKVRSGQRIMGFGHAVYTTDDPRSLMLRRVAQRLGGPLVDLAVEVERTVTDVLAELKPGRNLYANVEYYAGIVMSGCGVPPEMFTPTFASSRVIGWTANVLEQARDPKIIRPVARYVGPPPPQPVPPLA